MNGQSNMGSINSRSI